MAGASFGGCAIIGSLAVGVGYAQTKVPSQKQLVAQTSRASTVYFSNGKPVGTFGSTQHVILTYNQIPAVMREAAIAAEDKNFYHEGGVSITGIVRAAYYDLTSSGGNLQGASTITEQLVKNAYEGVSTQATNSGTLSSGLSNKVKEAFIAEKLSQEKSKAWIITEYLNTVPFGRQATGVGAAAEAFFGIPVSKLNTAQAAMLAAMIQSPSYYATPAGHQALVTRWRTHVLATMVQMGNLSPQAAAKLQFPKAIPYVINAWGNGWRGYIMQRVQYELANYWHVSMQRAGDLASTDGLKIYTTYSLHYMRALYATVAANQKLMNHCAPPSVALVGGGDPGAYGYSCKKLPPWVYTGAVLIQPSTGDILAEYGGKNFQKSQYDHAFASYQQVGSSFKPYVLATAIRQGMNAMNSIMNGYSPLWIPPFGPNGTTTYAKPGPETSPPKGTVGWYPVINDDTPASQGPVSVQHAMAASLNTAYTSLLARVGCKPLLDTLGKFGIDTGSESGLSSQCQTSSGTYGQAGVALGQGSLTVLEQASMIATIANNGTYVAPHAIAEIKAGSRKIRPPVPTHQALTTQQAAEMDWALSKDLIKGGTAPGDGLPNGQVAIAKTGTTNLAQSAFFLGATPRYAMAVGMFVQKSGCPKALQKACSSKSALQYAPPMGHGMQTLFRVGGLAGYGGGWPATIWHDFFTQEFSSLPVQSWPAPPNNLGQKWNLVGKLPKHKHKPKPKPTSSPTPTPFCHGAGQKSCPSPTPSPTLTYPTPSPTCTYTVQNKQSCPSPTPTTSTPAAAPTSTTAAIVVTDRRSLWNGIAIT